MNSRSFVWHWMPVIAWMALIFVASTDLMSGEHTSRFMVPFLYWLKPDISAVQIATIQFAIRKAAHVTEYAILAVLLFRAFLSRGQAQLRHMGGMLLIAGGYAALDEFHQSFVASRTGAPHDVLIDTCGALVGLAICWSFARRASTEPVGAA
jgi:VanZ family protein